MQIDFIDENCLLEDKKSIKQGEIIIDTWW